MASTSNVNVRTGSAAEKAAREVTRDIEAARAELKAAGAKSFEAAILLGDGRAISAVTGDEADD